MEHPPTISSQPRSPTPVATNLSSQLPHASWLDLETSLFAIANNGTSQTIYWLVAASQFALETTGALNATSQWQTITSGIVTLDGWKQYVVTNGPSVTNQFFLLR